MKTLIQQIDEALSHADEIGASATALWLDRARWAIEEDACPLVRAHPGRTPSEQGSLKQ